MSRSATIDPANHGLRSPQTLWRHTRVAATVVIAVTTFAVSLSSLVSQANAGANTLQMSSDNSADGWYPNQPQLTPSSVAGGDFGELFDTQLTGQVYAQPLVDQPTVLAVTQADWVYGINASSGRVNWSDNVGTPADPLAQIGCGDVGSSLGITGTPVIDHATNIAYFVAATDGGASGATEFFMDAVNVQTGVAPASWPVGGVPIQGSADNDPNTVFDGEYQTQRAGLVLVNGVIYAAFSSQCDYDSWTGWLIGVSESSHSITTRFATETGLNTTPSGGTGGAGIWQSGSAPVVDGNGDIFVSTGNGTIPSEPDAGSDTSVHNFGEAVIELSTSGGTLHVVDWFIPASAATLNSQDGDLGSGGPVELPASMGTSQEPNVMLVDGKQGILYALNMNALGGYEHGADQSDAVPFETNPYGAVWSRPTVWPGDGGYVYLPTAGTNWLAPNGGSLNVFQRMVSTSGAVYFNLVGATANSGNTFGFGSGQPIVTSNGVTSGSALVWIVHSSVAGGATSQLEAFDPIPQNPGPSGTLQEVWSSPDFTSAVFTEPSVDNGVVYVGTKDGAGGGTLLGFGLLPSTPALSGDDVNFAPTDVSQSLGATATFTATTSTTVSSFTPAGAAFSIGAPDLSLPTTLAMGQSITVPITFTPTALGTNAGTLTANITGGGTTSLSLSGDGLSASEPLDVAVPQSATPGEADFGLQPIAGPTVSQLVTFTNTSASAVNVTGLSAPALPFAIPNPPAAQTVQPGGTVSFTVDFTPPGSSGDFAHVFGGVATLDTSVGDFGVPVSGSAAPPAQISTVPSTLTFADVSLGTTTTLHFDVADQGGLPMTIVSSTPPSANGFAATSSLTVGTVFQGNTSVQETVTFSPATTGPVTATWTIEANDGSGPQTITMSGTGVAPPPPPSSPPPSSSPPSSSPPTTTLPPTGPGGGPSPPSPTLTIITRFGHVGTALLLRTRGDASGGALTFVIRHGTAKGCSLKGRELSVLGAGTCFVRATKSATASTSAVESPVTSISFVKHSRQGAGRT